MVRRAGLIKHNGRHWLKGDKVCQKWRVRFDRSTAHVNCSNDLFVLGGAKQAIELAEFTVIFCLPCFGGRQARQQSFRSCTYIRKCIPTPVVAWKSLCRPCSESLRAVGRTGNRIAQSVESAESNSPSRSASSGQPFIQYTSFGFFGTGGGLLRTGCGVTHPYSVHSTKFPLIGGVADGLGVVLKMARSVLVVPQAM